MIKSEDTVQHAKLLGLFWAAALLLLAAAVAALLFFAPVKVSFVDVDQGDACVIQGGRGGVVLIDGGDEGQGTNLQEFFRLQNIRKLDGVIVTHLHEDHALGVIELLDAGFPMERLYLPDVQSGMGLEQALLASAKRKNVPVTRLKRGDSFSLGRIAYAVLWPGDDRQTLDLNNSSLTLRASYGGTGVLFTADIEALAARRLALEEGGALQTQVLKVPHHGGESSLYREFINLCNPRWAVISVGLDNQYGDPSPKVLEALRQNGTQVWRTDLDGTVTMTLGPGKVRSIRRTNKWR